MPATLESVETLLTDLHARLEATTPSLTEEQVRALCAQVLQTALTDPEGPFRKLRFNGASQLVGSKFGRWGLSVSDVEWLYDMQTSLRGQKRIGEGFYTGPSPELEAAFKDVSDAHYLSQEEIRAIDRQAIDDMFPRISRHMIMQHEAALRAMDSAESGYGSQLIGAQYVADLWEAARRPSRVLGLIDQFEMLAPTVYMPVEVDFPELLYVGENTANNSSNYTTVKTGSNRVSVAAKKFIIHQMWSGELDEDSILPYIVFLRRQAELSLAHYGDSLVLNGDDTNTATGNINLDDADPPDTKHYLAADGIRHAGIVDNTANKLDMAGAVTFNALIGQRKRMVDRTYFHDWGHPNDPSDLVYITDPDTGDAIATLDEFVTVDKFGANATVLNGQVGRIGQNPLIGSMAMSLTEADGKVSTTGSNNVKGQVAAFNRRGMKLGWRRRVRLESERIIATDQFRIVYSMRLGVGRYTPTGAASGIEWADVLYNIAL